MALQQKVFQGGGCTSWFFRGQKKIEAFQAVPASNPGDELTKKEYIAGLWARKGLSYSLIDDWIFRKQFGVCVPVCVCRCV